MTARAKRPTSPGEMLREEFDVGSGHPVGIVAEKTNIRPEMLADLLEERIRVTPEIADALEEALDVPAAFWLNLQEKVDRWDALHAADDGTEQQEDA